MLLLQGQVDVKARDSQTVHCIHSIVRRIELGRLPCAKGKYEWFKDPFFKLYNVTVRWAGEIIQMKMEKLHLML